MNTENEKIVSDDKALLTEIYYYLLAGKFSVTKNLVEKVVDIDEALIMCVQYGDEDSVKYLVEKGADISINDYEPIRCATYKNHLTILQYFIIENNIDVSYGFNCTDSGQDTIKWAKEYKEKLAFNTKLNTALSNKKTEQRKKI